MLGSASAAAALAATGRVRSFTESIKALSYVAGCGFQPSRLRRFRRAAARSGLGRVALPIDWLARLRDNPWRGLTCRCSAGGCDAPMNRLQSAPGPPPEDSRPKRFGPAAA